MAWLRPDLSKYAGKWPPYPGCYPVLMIERGRLLTVHIWDQDASEARISEDLATIVPHDLPAGTMIKLHFGYPSEIAGLCREAYKTSTVMVDLEGTSKKTQAAFAAVMKDDPILTVQVG